MVWTNSMVPNLPQETLCDLPLDMTVTQLTGTCEMTPASLKAVSKLM